MPAQSEPEKDMERANAIALLHHSGLKFVGDGTAVIVIDPDGTNRYGQHGTATRYDSPQAAIRALGICGKCKRQRKTLHDYNSERWCGTCISRHERRINTQEMYGRGRRGY